ncbi:PH domain-containing protein [Microbacterium sp. PF5]|uniref:PH domain-containing protein n=1 Tax=Microbacterium sp. PF5 TaxID=2305435 RepID=UPI00406D4D1D
MVLTVWLWVRLPFTGVIPTERSVVVRSWFSRREYDRASILRFRHVEYSGLFFYLAWPSDTGWLASGMVEVELRNGTRIPLRATVCGIADARRIAEALNRWGGERVSATAAAPAAAGIMARVESHPRRGLSPGPGQGR